MNPGPIYEKTVPFIVIKHIFGGRGGGCVYTPPTSISEHLVSLSMVVLCFGPFGHLLMFVLFLTDVTLLRQVIVVLSFVFGTSFAETNV